MSKLRGNIIEPEIKQNKIINTCGWGGISKFKCGICGFHTRVLLKDGGDDNAKPQMIMHVIDEHPEYCYSCDNCLCFFPSKRDFKDHNCKILP